MPHSRPAGAPTSKHRGVLLPTVLALALALAAPAVDAQQVQGRLLEAGNRTPIMLGTVALLDTTLAVVDQTFTDEEGHFVLRAPTPGDYYIVADRLGYQPGADGVLELGVGGYIPIDFFLRPKPFELDPLVATAERQRITRHLTSQGFFERMDQGFGHFITPEELERKNAFDWETVLRAIPGVYPSDEGAFGSAVVFRGWRGEFCSPPIYYDGSPIQDLTVIDPSDVGAVEVFTRSTGLPLIYGGTEGACGAILIWGKGG